MVFAGNIALNDDNRVKINYKEPWRQSLQK